LSFKQPKRERLPAGSRRLLWAERTGGELIVGSTADVILGAVVAEFGIVYEPHALAGQALRARRCQLAVEVAEILQARALSDVEVRGLRLVEVLTADERAAVNAPKGWRLSPRPAFWTAVVPLFLTRQMEAPSLRGNVHIVPPHAWTMLKVLRDVKLVGNWGML
jgi:hypothetical protein